jgi:uncharacterized DUF497 family protein
MRIKRLFWDDNNVDHLWAAHQVSTTEVEEIIFGADGDVPQYDIVRDGGNYEIYGRTGGGRLLLMVGSLVGEGRMRIFAARDMDEREKRAFRKR